MQIDRIEGEIEEIEDNKTMLKHQLEEYEEGLEELNDELKSLGESSSHKFTRHVMLFEQFVNKLY
jgi:F0F1-type ATP synthase membrane subunit b/b'